MSFKETSISFFQEINWSKAVIAGATATITLLLVQALLGHNAIVQIGIILMGSQATSPQLYSIGGFFYLFWGILFAVGYELFSFQVKGINEFIKGLIYATLLTVIAYWGLPILAKTLGRSNVSYSKICEVLPAANQQNAFTKNNPTIAQEPLTPLNLPSPSSALNLSSTPSTLSSKSAELKPNESLENNSSTSIPTILLPSFYTKNDPKLSPTLETSLISKPAPTNTPITEPTAPSSTTSQPSATQKKSSEDTKNKEIEKKISPPETQNTVGFDFNNLPRRNIKMFAKLTPDFPCPGSLLEEESNNLIINWISYLTYGLVLAFMHRTRKES